jgi:hypothetical protein
VAPADRPREETRLERADRNLSELLQELRVALPGVQVVFAFLLTVPFTQRFESLSRYQKNLYFGTLLCTALTTALFVAPSANHRMLFRKRDKEYIVLVANRLAIAGLVTMAVSMCGAILLVSGLVFDAVIPAVATSGAAIVFAWLWFVHPIRRRHRLTDEPEPRTDPPS